MPPRLPRARLTAAVATLLLLAGCAAGGDGGSSDDAAADTGGSAMSLADEPADDEAAPARVASTPQQRAMVRTAEVSLRSEDPAAVARGVERLLTRWGGYVANEETVRADDGRVRGSHLEVRVPAGHYEELLGALDGLAEVTDTRRHAEDVTDRVVDLDARIRTHRVSLRRLRTLMASATDVDALVRIESEITRREADLEVLRGRRADVAGRVALARVALDVTTPDVEDEPLAEAGFGAGLSGGWHALGRLALVAVTAVGAALPFALVGAVLVVPVVAWTRQSRRRRTSPASEPPA